MDTEDNNMNLDFETIGLAVISPDAEAFTTEIVLEHSSADAVEYHALVRNTGSCSARLDAVRLLHICSLEEAGAGRAPYDIFRSGRHKNDLPGVFTTGCRDERLSDVSSVMTESGDGMEGSGADRVVSDHLTLIKGSGGKTLAVEFLTGRDQLFETVIDLDEDAQFRSLSSDVIFHIDLAPQQEVETESIRIALTDQPDEEVQQFAVRKAQRYGSRNRRHP